MKGQKQCSSAIFVRLILLEMKTRVQNVAFYDFIKININLLLYIKKGERNKKKCTKGGILLFIKKL